MRSLSIVPALLLAGCGQGDSVTVRDSEGNDRSVTITDTGGERTIASEDGMFKGRSGEDASKARFPGFAPQYPGSKVMNVTDMDVGPTGQTGYKMHMIVMHTDDSPDAVLRFYKDKAAASGKPVQDAGGTIIIGMTSPTEMDGTVSATAASGYTSITLSAVSKEKL